MAEILDHDFDGIQEYDNPIPVWLSAIFLVSMLFAAAYAFWYPAFPGHQGYSGWSSAEQYDQQMESEEARYAPLRAEAERKALEALAALTEDESTRQAGHEVFKVRCSPCHGINGEGRVGPSLTDETWLYGGEPKDVLESIREGRPKGMPSWKTELSDDEVQNVTVFVLSLGDGPAPEEAP